MVYVLIMSTGCDDSIYLLNSPLQVGCKMEQLKDEVWDEGLASFVEFKVSKCEFEKCKLIYTKTYVFSYDVISEIRETGDLYG